MKKLLLSLLASTIYTSTVSAQTCQQPPSCESLGYTKSVDDCGDIEYLTCPFDSSKVYCSGGSSLVDDYLCKEDDALIFTLHNGWSSSISVVFHLEGVTEAIVDCGTNYKQIVKKQTVINSQVETTIGCGSLAVNSDMEYRLCGNFKKFKGYHGRYNGDLVASNVAISSVKAITLQSLEELPKLCDVSTVGSIPKLKLPPSITSIDGLFSGCSGLTGDIPELPSGITSMNSAFEGCTGLTGNIPEIPPTVTSMTSAFKQCDGLSGEAPQMPTGITEYSNAFPGTATYKVLQGYTYSTNISNNTITPWPDSAWCYYYSSSLAGIKRCQEK
ncbi:MAG: hypothetical protein E7012_02635 [Alphaproteobacteria bacterium]|nr:hypothetical protein [Alphaproteobacteria bacterium]